MTACCRPPVSPATRNCRGLARVDGRLMQAGSPARLDRTQCVIGYAQEARLRYERLLWPASKSAINPAPIFERNIIDPGSPSIGGKTRPKDSKPKASRTCKIWQINLCLNGVKHGGSIAKECCGMVCINSVARNLDVLGLLRWSLLKIFAPRSESKSGIVMSRVAAFHGRAPQRNNGREVNLGGEQDARIKRAVEQVRNQFR
jgi:hypothetical protein